MSKRWVLIFKALGNINRLKIIKLLADGKSLNVSEISRTIDISLNATSKHLIILTNLDAVEGIGKDGHVFYRFNSDLPNDIKKAVRLFI